MIPGHVLAIRMVASQGHCSRSSSPERPPGHWRRARSEDLRRSKSRDSWRSPRRRSPRSPLRRAPRHDRYDRRIYDREERRRCDRRPRSLSPLRLRQRMDVPAADAWHGTFQVRPPMKIRSASIAYNYRIQNGGRQPFLKGGQHFSCLSETCFRLLMPFYAEFGPSNGRQMRFEAINAVKTSLKSRGQASALRHEGHGGGSKDGWPKSAAHHLLPL